MLNRVVEKLSKGETVSMAADGRLLASDNGKFLVLDLDDLGDFRDKKFVVTQVLSYQQDICNRWIQVEAEKTRQRLTQEASQQAVPLQQAHLPHLTVVDSAKE